MQRCFNTVSTSVSNGVRGFLSGIASVFKPKVEKNICAAPAEDISGGSAPVSLDVSGASTNTDLSGSAKVAVSDLSGAQVVNIEEAASCLRCDKSCPNLVCPVKMVASEKAASEKPGALTILSPKSVSD